MKCLLITLTSILIGIIALPQKVEAGHKHCGKSYTYRCGQTSCGCPIYKRRVIVSYDCRHRPIYRYYSVPVVHRCRSYCKPPHRHHHYTRHYSRPVHYRSHHGSITYSNRYGSITLCR